MKLLLGSNSPRRNELLAQLGYSFNKVAIACDEDFEASMNSNEVAEYLACKKSMAYPGLQKDEILITADTVVINDHHILNKPADANEAYRMLSSLSGGTHLVQTGVCIRSMEKQISFTSTTEVVVDDLSDEEILHYVEVYKPYDKAGAYGIQEWFGLALVKEIKGCFYNVVGLPTSELFKRLKNDYNVK